MDDPEGVADTPFRWAGICMDCGDAEEMARFYGELFGWEVTASDEPTGRRGGMGWIAMNGPAGGPTVSFQAEEWYEPPVWPEVVGAIAKMIHFEVEVTDIDLAVAAVVRAGGKVAPWQPPDRDPSQLRVVLDPAGHPVCLCCE